mgnify:CR=1 FL=1
MLKKIFTVADTLWVPQKGAVIVSEVRESDTFEDVGVGKPIIKFVPLRDFELFPEDMA